MTALRVLSEKAIAARKSFEAAAPASEPSADAPAPASRHHWLLTIQIAGTLVLVTWIFWQIDFEPLLGHFAIMRWGVVALLFAIGLLDRFLAAWKWHILLVTTTTQLRLIEAFRIQMIATFFGSFLPTAVGMDAVRIYLASKATRRTLDSVSASTVDRLLTVLGTFVVVGGVTAAAALQQGRVAQYWLILFPMLLIAAVWVIVRARRMLPLRSMFLRLLGERLTTVAARLYRSLHEFNRRPGALAACCAVTAASFVVRVLFVQVAAVALTVEVSLAALAVSLPVTWVALMLPVSIGGLGLQEGAYLVALTAVGVDPASAVAISLLDQMAMRVVSLLGVVFWLSGRRTVDGSIVAP